MRILRRYLLFALAIVFLVEAWIWDSFVAGWRWLAAHIPFEALKAAIARGVEKLPPYAALVLFAIPGLVVLPFKLAGLWLIGHGHFIAGGGVFLAAKIAGVGVAAFLFELTRAKLMTLRWFNVLYEAVMRWRDWAHRLVDPYTSVVRAQARTLKLQFLRATAGQRSRLAKTIVRLRERIRRARTQG